MKAVSENNVGKTIKQSKTINQPDGYYAYFPHKLESIGPKGIRWDNDLINLLADASRALGELNGITKLLKNPNLFIAFYVQKEALLSSQIEGTQCSLEEVLQFDESHTEMKPVDEVVNYIKAMKLGLEKLKKLPFSLRLIKEIHQTLLRDVRGGEKLSGEFKKTQNWIGHPGCQIDEAVFVPVPPNFTLEYMEDLEKYYHKQNGCHLLVKAAVIHSYFETIHPFNDGNGRIGRLLITFLLCDKKILQGPLLYLSLFFKEHRSDYYDLLMKVRFEGDWNEWIKFFLRGIRETSLEALNTANQLFDFIDSQRNIVTKKLKGYKYSHPIYEILCRNPLISISKLSKVSNIPYPTVKRTIEAFQKVEIVSLKNFPMGTVISMDKYLAILKRGTE